MNLIFDNFSLNGDNIQQNLGEAIIEKIWDKTHKGLFGKVKQQEHESLF